MRLGIMVNNLIFSDKSYQICTQINKNKGLFEDICIFSEDVSSRIIDPRCAIYEMCYAWDFKGVLISTCIDTTSILKNVFGPSDKYWYLFNLEWMGKVFNYDILSDLILDTEIKKISSQPNYDKVIQNLCNIQSDILIEDFNLEEIYEFCSKK